MSAPILVLGVGNPLLGDEGIGPHAVAELGARFHFPSQLELLDGGTAGLALFADVAECEKLLVLDAIRTGARPGSLIVLDGRDLYRSSQTTLSPHHIGLADVLAASRWKGGPEEVKVFGLEPESLELGLELSRPVREGLPALIHAVLAQLRCWGAVIEARDRPTGAAGKAATPMPLGA